MLVFLFMSRLSILWIKHLFFVLFSALFFLGILVPALSFYFLFVCSTHGFDRAGIKTLLRTAPHGSSTLRSFKRFIASFSRLATLTASPRLSSMFSTRTTITASTSPSLSAHSPSRRAAALTRSSTGRSSCTTSTTTARLSLARCSRSSMPSTRWWAIW